jgi:hypothetical protein
VSLRLSEVPGLFSLLVLAGGGSSTSMELLSAVSATISGGLSGRSSGGLGECPEGAFLGDTSSWERGNMT